MDIDEGDWKNLRSVISQSKVLAKFVQETGQILAKMCADFPVKVQIVL